MAKRGPKGIYDEEIFEELLARISDGESMRTICAEDGMPSRICVFNWLRARPELMERYNRARELQAHAMADLAADMTRPGGVNDPPADNVRLRAIQWAAGHLLPKVYGVKSSQDVKVEGADGGPATFVMKLVSGDGAK